MKRQADNIKRAELKAAGLPIPKELKLYSWEKAEEDVTLRP
jgi:hypothetical protein